MAFRLLYVAYVFVFGMLLMNLIKHLMAGRLPAPYKGKSLRYLIDGFAIAVLWPIALLSKKGRETLRHNLAR